MCAGSGIDGDVEPAELLSTLTSVTVSKCSLTYVQVRNCLRHTGRRSNPSSKNSRGVKAALGRRHPAGARQRPTSDGLSPQLKMVERIFSKDGDIAGPPTPDPERFPAGYVGAAQQP